MQMKRQSKWLSLLIYCTLVLFTVPASAADLTLTEPFPRVGYAVKVQAINLEPNEDASDLVLKAVYRPNSKTEYDTVLSSPQSPGEWTLVPEKAGLLLLKLVSHKGEKERTVASKQVSVCFAKTPISGILVMLLAAVILFGGIAITISWALATTSFEPD